MNYYKRHIGDYAKKTRHLSTWEHGAYTLILDAYYDREQPPTTEEAMRWACAKEPNEKRTVSDLLAEFFTLVDGRWVQQRVEDEIAAAMTISNTNRTNGKLGGRPRKTPKNRSVSERLANDNRNERQSTNPLIHKSTTEKAKAKDSSSTDVDGFAEFWSAYPRKVGKADAVKAWGKIKPDPETMKDIVAAIAVQSESEQWTKHNGQFIPHPATWLNGRRWEDEAQQSASASDIGRLAI